MPNIKLTYFNAPGRAESVRVALFIAGLPFEDHRLDFPEFAALKAQGAFPLGSVPVLEVDGLTLTQTAAMLRYVARLGQTDLYPTDPFEAFIVDSALDTFNDTLSNALLPSMYERDMTKRLELRAEFAAGPLPRACAYVESLLERSGGPFVCGESMTIADIVLALQALQVRSGVLDGLTAEALTPYPRLCALAEAYLADPRIVAYHQR
jgi:prostaglandin-H2 D-isomerase / glutathione transferase